MVYQSHDAVLDGALQLKDAGLVAATAYSTVSSSTVTIDLGVDGNSVAPYVKGRIIIDTTAVEVASGDEVYDFQVAGATASSFATVYRGMGRKTIGATSPTGLPFATPAAGRHVIYFDNVAMDTNGLPFACRYLRLQCIVAGTVATGINYTAWMVRDQ